MKAEPIYPIHALHGRITKHYYCRQQNGRLIIQRCPNRSGHVPTAKEAANRQLFAARYRVKSSTY